MNAGIALFDEDVVRAMLALTGSAVNSEEHAAKLFAQIARGRPGVSEATAAYKDTSFDTSDWAAGQAIARRWLPDVAMFDRLSASKRAAFFHDFNEKLQAIGGLKLEVGELGLMVRPPRDRDSITDACMRAFIPFLVPTGWDHRRLGQCQYEECGQWFLRPPPKRGSVPLYCSQKHANLARVRAFREKQRRG